MLLLLAMGLLVLYLGSGVVLDAWFHEVTYDNSQKVIGLLRKASPIDVRLCRCSADEDVEFQTAHGLTIAGSLYGADGEDGAPGVIVLHGSGPLGRKLPVYQVLADRLSARGLVVLTMDFAGSGESDDPFELDSGIALDRDEDVRSALRYLRSLDAVDPGRIYLVGHSQGAASGFSVGIEDPGVQGIVAIGPPRRLTERLSDPDDRDYFWTREQRNRRRSVGSEFPTWYTQEVWLERTVASDMARHTDYFSQPQHKPLLLIDGELEGSADVEYLRRFYESISEPKEYRTIQASDHYANTIRVGGLLAYDRGAMADTVDAIAGWIDRNGPDGSR